MNGIRAFETTPDVVMIVILDGRDAASVLSRIPQYEPRFACHSANLRGGERNVSRIDSSSIARWKIISRDPRRHPFAVLDESRPANFRGCIFVLSDYPRSRAKNNARKEGAGFSFLQTPRNHLSWRALS